jgi:hypothetical protein
MNKKQIFSFIIPLTILGLLIIGLWLFQHFSKPEESSSPYAYSSSSQPWSQAEDFVLEEKTNGILIKNLRIPFSCQLPLGWRAEIEKIKEGEWAINTYSSETTFNSNHLIEEGCWLTLETVQSGELHSLLEKEIQQLLESANLLNSEPIFETAQGEEHRVLLTGSYYPALEEKGPWLNNRQLITVYLPLEKGQIVKWEGQFSRNSQENCQQDLESILNTIKAD